MFFVVLGNCFSQKEITWEDLKCKFEEVWIEDSTLMYLKPSFHEKQKKIDNTAVRIVGVLNPVDFEDGYFVLCQGNSGKICFDLDQDEIIAIEFNESPNNWNLDKLYEVEGLLLLNKDDMYQLSYILKDAKIIREVKN
jgi:hypothetical protein